MLIQANNPEQEEAEEEVEVELQRARSIEIGFNVSYLLDALGVGRRPSRCACSVSDANSSCLVEAKEAVTLNYVVMPMRL